MFHNEKNRIPRQQNEQKPLQRQIADPFSLTPHSPDATNSPPLISGLGHDLTRIRLHADERTVSQPSETAEQEASQIAEQVVQQNVLVPPLASPGTTLNHTVENSAEADVVPEESDGQPLDERTRSFMEPRFGHDFSKIRIYADERATQAALTFDALAYTVGSNIVFQQDHYAPDTSAGQKLLAHELAHTVQQKQGGTQSVVQRQEAPTQTPPASTPPGGSSNLTDDQLETVLNNQPDFVGMPFLQPLGGLHAMEQNYPHSFPIIQQRITAHFGGPVYNWLYTNDARILHLVQNADALRTHTDELYTQYMRDGQQVAYETVWQIAREYEFTYEKAIQGYQQAGDAVLAIWEGFLGGNVEQTALDIKGAAEQNQANENERARLAQERSEIGRQAIGTIVASREVWYWWDDSITLKDLLTPEDGVENEAQALALARSSGKATAVLQRQGRYYIYELNHQYSYSDIWEHSVFEEHRTRVVPSAQSPALALTTVEGYVIRPQDQARFFGGDQTRSPGSYLAGDLQAIDAQSGSMSNEQTLNLFQQSVLDLVMVKLGDSEQHLQEAQGRFYPEGLLDPKQGEELQRNTATLRRHLMTAATLAARFEGKNPTEPELEEAQEILAAIGRIASADPTTTMMIVNHRDEGATNAPGEGDIEDRVAGKRSGDAAATALDEIRLRLGNIDTVRRYLYAHPTEVLAFTQLHEEILQRFSPSQRLYLQTEIMLHDLGQLAKTLGIALLDLTLLITGMLTGGATALVAWGISSAVGVGQVAAGFAEAQRLSAMSALDLPGGFQLATPEEAAHAQRWAWIGLALSLLDIGMFVRSAGQLARLRSVLRSPDLAAVLNNSEQSLRQVAEQMGTSEEALIRQLETATGPERAALIARMREIANVPRAGGLAGISPSWIGKTEEEVEALRVELMARQDVGRVQRTLQELGINADRELLDAVKNYNFNSRGLAFTSENYTAWTRLAAGNGTVDDARYIVHEISEVEALRNIQQTRGFDFMGKNWETMSAAERQRWSATFEHYYMQAHEQALTQEYDFIADEVRSVTNNRVRISRAVAAAVDPTREEAREFMLVDGVPLRDHRQFYQWQSRATEIVDIGTATRTRLRLPLDGDVTLSDLIRVLKQTRLQNL